MKVELSNTTLISLSTVLIGLIGIAGYYFLPAIIVYLSAVRQRLRQESERYFGKRRRDNKDPFRFIRDPSILTSREHHRSTLLELNPAFKERQTKAGWSLLSFGDYVSSLVPAIAPDLDDEKVPEWISNEIEAALGAAILQILGPIMGAAILPTVGILRTPIEKLSSTNAAIATVSHFLMARAVTAGGGQRQSGSDGHKNLGALAFTFSELTSMSDTYAKISSFQKSGKTGTTSTADDNKPSSSNVEKDTNTDETSTPLADNSPLGAMRVGEIGYNPHFGMDFVYEENVHLVPNPFIVSKHWDNAITGMEERMRLHLSMARVDQQQPTTNPATQEEEEEALEESQMRVSIVLPNQPYVSGDRTLPPPVPVNERMLPDLHVGYGDAQCTHTKQEVIRNRLLCVLLNRLAFNYYGMVSPNNAAASSDQFIVKMDDGARVRELTTPGDFVQALLKSGHTVEVCPRAAITTFGFGLCVKEPEGKFSNIPLAFFLHSGFENEHGDPVLAYLPHGGVDLDIKGPLVGIDEATGKSRRCNIQHYMAIEGMCGWHSNHNVDCPWIKPVSLCDPFRGNAAVDAVRIAALCAVITNMVGTELDLPYGGYGLTGVCNDSAALVEFAMTGKTHVYPLSSIGRFMCEFLRRAQRVKKRLETCPNRKKEVQAVRRIISSILELPTDISSSPAQVEPSGERLLRTLPDDPPFQAMVEAKSIMESIKKEHLSYRK